MANPEPRVERPRHLDRVPRTPEELLAIGAEIISDYLDPEGELSERDVLDRMIELFYNPMAIEALDREMQRRAGGRDADRWH